MFSYWTSYNSWTSTDGHLSTMAFFRPNGQKNSHIDSCFKPLYNGHLFIMATIFCPQGGRCREVQIYITTWLVKHPLKYGATCHGWVFCFLSHVTRSSTRFPITCSRFPILDSCRNGESSRESRLTTDCKLTFEWYCMVHVQRFGWFLVKTFTPA